MLIYTLFILLLYTFVNLNGLAKHHNSDNLVFVASYLIITILIIIPYIYLIALLWSQRWL